ncbi:MAG TPA: hypothetical protein PLE19_02045 [Planctomycetota bacterium]|nr:hypothetical protein [Planctomycetota bacterium]HRR78654.1 hypothetical protein [Planctomycetota bacterium]HRT97522.1 hypothetical protein [Planctomycetota bacterium]
MSKLAPVVKGFDCVEMKRRIQEGIYAETQDMDQAELLAYFRRRVGASRFAPFFGLSPKPQSRKRVSKRSGA